MSISGCRGSAHGIGNGAAEPEHLVRLVAKRFAVRRNCVHEVELWRVPIGAVIMRHDKGDDGLVRGYVASKKKETSTTGVTGICCERRRSA